MGLSIKKLQYKILENKAFKLFQNKSRLIKLLVESVQFLKDKSLREEVKENVLTFVEMLKAYVNGTYRQVSKKNIILMIIGLLYLIMPLDAVPDFIPISGFVDDTVVIFSIYKLLILDVNRFKAFKDKDKNQN